MKIDSLIPDVSAMVSQIRAESEVFGKFLMLFGQIGSLLWSGARLWSRNLINEKSVGTPVRAQCVFFVLSLAVFGQYRPLL